MASGGDGRTARWAWAAALLWLVCVAAYAAGYFLGAAEAPPAGLAALLFVAAALGPLAPLAAASALVAEARRLRAAPPPTAPAPSTPTPPTGGEAATVAKALVGRLDALEASVRALRAATAAAPPAMQAARPPQPANEPPLPFADAPEREAASSIPWADLIRALDFPRDTADAAGFAAVRSAVRDPEAARLLQAAEDVLSILASLGLHMEDLRAPPPSAAAWRAYAEGARGAAAAGVGALRDPAAVRAAKERLRADPIFRDAALVFIRRWNQFLARAARELSDDAPLSALGDTRTARAFMLTARALGAFD